MIRWVGRSWKALRRRPFTVLLTLFLLLAGAAVSLHLWARHQFSVAQRAVADEELIEAHQAIESCLRIWRWSVPAHLLAARIERLNRRFVAAHRLLDACEHLQDGPSEETQLERIFLRAETGEFAELEEGLWRAVEEAPNHRPAILETLTRIYLQAAHTNMGIRAIGRWLEVDPESAGAWWWKGWVLERLRRRSDAITAYKRCLELNPHRWQAANSLVTLLLADHRSAEAMPFIRLLRERHPSFPESRMALASYYISQGQDEQATQMLDDLLRDHPDFLPGLVQRGKLACEARKPQDGKQYLQKARALRPHEPSVLIAYYRCLQQLGETTEAAKVREESETAELQYAKLDDLLTNGVEKYRNDPAILCNVAHLLTVLEIDPSSAVDWYYRALRVDPNCIAAHEALERFFEAHGDTVRAEQHREKLKALRGK
jgi:tetratricopeptide (TPR) repeat protein